MSVDTYPEYHAEAQEGLDVRQFWAILRKRRGTFLQIFILVLVVGAAATVLSKPVYQARAKLHVPAGTNTVNFINSDNPIGILMSAANPDTIGSQIQMMQGRDFIRRAFKASGIKTQPGVVPPSVRVEALRESNVIQVLVDGGNPRYIALLANAIVKQHIEESKAKRDRGLDTSLDYMDKETKKANAEWLAATNKLAEFRASHPFEVSEAQVLARQQAYVQAESDQLAAQSNVSSTRGQISRLEAKLESMPPDITRQRKKDNPLRASLDEKLRAARLKQIEVNRNYLPDTDEAKAAQEEVDDAKRNLDAQPLSVDETVYIPNPNREMADKQLIEAESNLVKHEEALRAASAQVGVLRQQLIAASPWKPKLEALMLAADRTGARHKLFSDKLQDLRIRKEAGGYTGAPIEVASEPNKPIQPKPALNIALAVILGLCMATGVVFLQEYLDDRIHEPDDLQRLAKLPSLGHIPAIGPGDPRLLSQLASDSHVSEAYRAIRSAIGFAGLDGPLRLIQVTSASKGEGKSLTSINTATALAMDGKRVILVDADMRRPSLHRTLAFPLSPGLSEVLVGQRTWQECMHDTDVPNMRVMCAGTMPPNPAELLGNRAFDNLLEELTKAADVVVVDTPPCMPVTDPLIIASRMDAVILVISAGATRRGAIKHVMGLLHRARARVVGAVFNRVDAKSGGYYYQYYKHYYGDGYYSDTGSSNGGHRRRNGKLPESVDADEALATSASKD